MTLKEQTYDFEEEIERLEKRLKTISEKVVSLDDNNPRKQELISEGQQLDAQLVGARWAHHEAHDDEDVPQWDEDVDSVTLGGLSGREFGRLEDDVSVDPNAGSGSTRTLLVADGTVDAPYVEEDMSDAERVKETGDLFLPYLKWAEARIDEMTTGREGNGKRFGDYLAAARQETKSTDD